MTTTPCKTKPLTIYLTWRADAEPGRKGYSIALADPDPGIPRERRTPGSGYAVPMVILAPAGVELSETKYGEAALFAGDQMLTLAYSDPTPRHPARVVTAWAAGSRKPAKRSDRMIFPAVI